MKKLYKCTLTMIVMMLLFGTVSVSAGYRPGSRDDDYQGMIYAYYEGRIALEVVNDSIHDSAINGGLSTSVLEDALNRGFCLEYVDLYKANGLIPQDFQPGTSTTTEQTITDTSTSTTDTSEQTEKTYSEVEIEAAWKETSRTEASCTEAGVIKYKNSLTGKTKSEEIPTVDHDYEITEEIPATCIEDGNVTYTCTMCGDSYSETVEKTEHDYVETSRTEATCTEDGEVLYVCAECENAYTDTLPATGHTKGDWEVTKEAGIFSKGEKVLKCSICGEVLETATIPQTSPVSLAVIILIGVVAVAGIGIGAVVFAKKKRR